MVFHSPRPIEDGGHHVSVSNFIIFNNLGFCCYKADLLCSPSTQTPRLFLTMLLDPLILVLFLVANADSSLSTAFYAHLDSTPSFSRRWRTLNSLHLRHLANWLWLLAQPFLLLPKL